MRIRSIASCLLALLLVLGFAVPSQASLFWSNGTTNAIGSAASDGTDVDQSLIASVPNAQVATTDGEYLYWSSTSGISRARVDGTGREDAFIPASKLDGTAISLTYANGYLYMCYGSVPRVSRAKADGTQIRRDWLVVAGSIAYATGVAANSTHLFIRFLEPALGNSSIGRVKLDGTGFTPNIVTGSAGLLGIAANDKYVFWLNGTYVGRADAAGGGVRKQFISGVPTTSIAIAADDDHVYWAEIAGKKIKRATVAGTQARTLVSVAGAPFALAVTATPPPPPTPKEQVPLKDCVIVPAEIPDTGIVKVMDEPCVTNAGNDVSFGVQRTKGDVRSVRIIRRTWGPRADQGTYVQTFNYQQPFAAGLDCPSKDWV